MDNGTLVFIIIIALVVIVWQASKLQQYSKFEKILSVGVRAADDTGSQDTAGVPSSQASGKYEPDSSRADSASRAVARAMSADGVSANDMGADGRNADGMSREHTSAQDLTVDDIDEQILNSAEVDPEANIEEAKRVQLVMARCRYAEFYLEQLDDDYERGQFQRIINSCKSTARNIQDPFFRASALQCLILLLDRAELESERDELLAEVDDDLMRQRIAEELASGAEA